MAEAQHPPRSAPPGPVDPRARRRRISLYIAIAAGCLVAFWALASLLVANNWLVPFDQSVNAFVRSIRAPWLNTAMWLVSLPGDPPVIAPMTVIAALILAMWGWRSGAVLLVVAMAGEAVVQRFVSVHYARIRPPLRFALIKPPVTLSFPSGHAWATLLLTALLGLILWRTISRRWAARGTILAAVVALTLVVGVSRVYLGVHWPTDVVGGWILAVFSLVLTGAIYLWLVKRFEIKELMPPLGTLPMRVALTALGIAFVLALLVYDAGLNPLLNRPLASGARHSISARIDSAVG